LNRHTGLRGSNLALHRFAVPHHQENNDMCNRVNGWCASVCSLSLFSLAALQIGAGAAFAQSSGSGGGSFSNAFLIPTVVCSAGSFDPSTLTCDHAGGGAKVLFGNIKTPSAANKNVLIMATLESSILTNTVVASKGGNNSTSTASASVIVTPKVYLCPSNDCSGASGTLVDITTMGGSVTPDRVTFNQRTQTLSAKPRRSELHREHHNRSHHLHRS